MSCNDEWACCFRLRAFWKVRWDFCKMLNFCAPSPDRSRERGLRCALPDTFRRTAMSDNHTYKKVEIVGSSTTTIEDAINNALAEASKSLSHLEWFEVTET
ncbi:hypothetical protein ALO94_01788, partial [Pseudomonas syringae pv. spinaceae]